MMDRDPNVSQGGLTGEVRLRVPLPIIVPFGALLLIGAMAFGFSRILLSVPKEIATIVATVTAINILGACAVLALRKDLNRSIVTELMIVVLYPVVIGAVIATMNLDTAHGEEGGGHAPVAGEEPPPEESGSTTVTASGTAFDTNELVLTAGEVNQVEFINEDTVPHNISVYEDDSTDNTIFEGELITDDTITYEIEAPNEPGEAYFQCDVHPTMSGTALIE